jgi:hypothetical protein
MGDQSSLTEGGDHFLGIDFIPDFVGDSHRIRKMPQEKAEGDDFFITARN